MVRRVCLFKIFPPCFPVFQGKKGALVRLWIIKRMDIMSGVFEYTVILGGLFCIARISRGYQIHIEPRIQGRIGRRLVCFSALLLIFWTGYGIVVFTGIKNNYITGVLTANLIVFAAVFGNWLASPLKRPAELVPLCLVVALSDIFSVFAGPTKQFAGTISQYYEGGMEGIPPLVDFILVKMPLPGQKFFMPVFGITDWIVIVLLSAGAVKFNMDDNLLLTRKARSGRRGQLFFFPVAGLGLILSIVAARELNLYLPALPLIVLVFLGVMTVRYPEIRLLTRAELKPMALVFFLMVSLMVVSHMR